MEGGRFKAWARGIVVDEGGAGGGACNEEDSDETGVGG